MVSNIIVHLFSKCVYFYKYNAVVGAGYYFKIYKKKQEENEDEEDYNELEDDYESEDNIEEPEEISEEEEQEEVDDMAINVYDEEDDE